MPIKISLTTPYISNETGSINMGMELTGVSYDNALETVEDFKRMRAKGLTLGSVLKFLSNIFVFAK